MNTDQDFKIKLIHPCRIEYFNPSSFIYANYLPYGMGVLTAFLRENGCHVDQVDLSVQFNFCEPSFIRRAIKNLASLFKNKYRTVEGILDEEFINTGKIDEMMLPYIDSILNACSLKGYSIIGFSVFTFYQFQLALMLSQRIKQRSSAVIVFGGPVLGMYGHLYYSSLFNFIDYVVIGDGRIPLFELMQYLRGETILSKVPNIIYKKDGKLIFNPREEFSIEDIPSPDFDGLAINLYRNQNKNGPVLPYQISRGCPTLCSFCNNPELSTKLAFKSYSKIITELSHMKEKYNSAMFTFCDDAINYSYEYLDGLCDLFIKHKLNIEWRTHAKVKNLDKYILAKMRRAGCRRLFFGIESGSNRLLESMNKGFSIEQASRTIKDVSEAGITVFVSLMAGYVRETQEDINKTIKFIKEHNRYVFFFYVYPFILKHGSQIYCNPDKYGIKIRPSHFCFDEINGLTWKEKIKQQRDSYRQITWATYENLQFSKKCDFLFFHFLEFCRRILGRIKTTYFKNHGDSKRDTACASSAGCIALGRKQP